VVPGDETYSTITFQVKYSTTKMKKLMDAFAQKQNLDVKTFRFCFNEIRISGDETAKQLEMEEGDEIDVYLEQTAGQLF
jgi:small ubiquitin-related modifier